MTVTSKNITVILPALNEEQGIKPTIEEIQQLPYRCRIVVADNGSTDKTVDMVRSCGIELIHVPHRGKGNAVRTALSQVKFMDVDYVLMLDSDHTYPPAYIPAILSLLQVDYEAVVGTRALVIPGAMSWVHKAGNTGLSVMASLLYQHHISDICSGMWGFRGYVAKKLMLQSAGFTLEAEIFTEIMRLGYKLAEVPIRYDTRMGEAHLNIKHGAQIAGFLVKRRFNRK